MGTLTNKLLIPLSIQKYGRELQILNAVGAHVGYLDRMSGNKENYKAANTEFTNSYDHAVKLGEISNMSDIGLIASVLGFYDKSTNKNFLNKYYEILTNSYAKGFNEGTTLWSEEVKNELYSILDTLPFGINKFITTTFNTNFCYDMNQVDNVISFLRQGDVPDAVSNIILDKKVPTTIKSLEAAIKTNSLKLLSVGALKKVYDIPGGLCPSQNTNFIYKISIDLSSQSNASGCSAYWENMQFSVKKGTSLVTYPRLQYYCSNAMIEVFANIYTSDLLSKGYTPHLIYTPEQYIKYSFENNTRKYVGHTIQEKISGDVLGDLHKFIPGINRVFDPTSNSAVLRPDFFVSIQVQIAFTLLILQKTLMFASNDLWLKNLYFKYTPLGQPNFAGKVDLNSRPFVSYVLDSNTYFNIKQTGLRIIVSDFDRCRFETASVVFNNLDQYKYPGTNQYNKENASNKLLGREYYDYLYQLAQWLWMFVNAWPYVYKAHPSAVIASFSDQEFESWKWSIALSFLMVLYVLYGDYDISLMGPILSPIMTNVGKNSYNAGILSDQLGNIQVVSPAGAIRTVNQLFDKVYGVSLSSWLKTSTTPFNHFLPLNKPEKRFDIAKYLVWVNNLVKNDQRFSEIFRLDVPTFSETFVYDIKNIQGEYTWSNVKTLHKFLDLDISSPDPGIVPPRLMMKPITGLNSRILIPQSFPVKSRDIGRGIQVYEFSANFSSLGYELPTQPGYFYDGYNMKNIPINETMQDQYLTAVLIPKQSYKNISVDLYHYDAPKTVEQAKNDQKKSMQQIFGMIDFDKAGVIVSGEYFNYKNWVRLPDGKIDVVPACTANIKPGCNCNPAGPCAPPTCNRTVGYYKDKTMKTPGLDEEVPEIYKDFFGVIGFSLDSKGNLRVPSITKAPTTVQDIVLSGGPILVSPDGNFTDQIARSADPNLVIRRLSRTGQNRDVFGPCISDTDTIGGYLNHALSPNPRLVIGITANGDLIFVSVEGRLNRGYGVDFIQLENIMKSLGCASAINLDGGKTSDIMYKPENSIPSVLVNTNPVHKLDNVVDFMGGIFPGLYPSSALIFKTV